MIVSHKLRLIFLKTKKCAGSSVETILSKFCGDQDIITPDTAEEVELRKVNGIRLPQNYYEPLKKYTRSDYRKVIASGRWHQKLHPHMTGGDLRAYLGEDVWQNYLKVSISRNPYDYAVSRYYWEKRLGNTNLTIGEFLRERPDVLCENRRILFQDENCVVDSRLRFEHLAQDLDELGKTLGIHDNLGSLLDSLSSKRGARPAKATKHDIFNDLPNEKKLIEILCKIELNSFGYTF